MLSGIYDILLKENQIDEQKAAVKDNRNIYTYSEMRKIIDHLADILTLKGLKRGDRAALYLPNSFAFIVIYFACSKDGIICVPLNWVNNPLNISHILEDSGSSAIIGYESKLQEFVSDELIRDNLYKDVCIALLPKEETEKQDKKENYFGDVNLLLYTSGSTGQAKGVILTHYTSER